ncbi:hypothetical protein [Falsiphaeobacter marinintestinus]|uniref:hypothetical protein n=1 Tax=Falsiphaeobacter marinintestinus TaxID=1492905 RepID=UPI0011B4AFF4|nr:hypothetical protein [Phaeobacter marinintestinus]
MNEAERRSYQRLWQTALQHLIDNTCGIGPPADVEYARQLLLNRDSHVRKMCALAGIDEDFAEKFYALAEQLADADWDLSAVISPHKELPDALKKQIELLKGYSARGNVKYLAAVKKSQEKHAAQLKRQAERAEKYAAYKRKLQLKREAEKLAKLQYAAIRPVELELCVA